MNREPDTPFVVPPNPEELKIWLQARIQEPCAAWAPRRRGARGLPVPVNLPGMEKAAAAVLAKYPSMSVEWQADVIQDFLLYLLRPETVDTLAASALSGVARRQVGTLEKGIAWKLRMEILSRASRAYKKSKREAELFVDPAECARGGRRVA